MRFASYLESKIGFVLFETSFIFLTLIILALGGASFSFVIFAGVTMLLGLVIFLIIDYLVNLKRQNEIHGLVDSLEEKYYVSEVLKKPRKMEQEAYYYALKKACKAMNDKISKLSQDKNNYEEYVESFAHEIKTPLAALSLYADNNKDELLKEELDKIDNLVEQMLYYARSENTQKDYFVSETKLEEIVHTVVIYYKNYLLKRGIKLNVHDLDKVVYTDEKWVTFIISQILQNAIKYLNKRRKQIEIYALENKNNVVLFIKDNGVGISEADLKRVYEKGFTGSNRKKTAATGMGLYLCDKLCNRLNLKIEINAEIGKGTTVMIIFPKTKIAMMFNK